MVFTKLDIFTLMKILTQCKMSRNILDFYMAQKYTVQTYARLLTILMLGGALFTKVFAGELIKIQCLEIGQNCLLTNSHLISSHDYLPISADT
jgi:hypothetical protein